MGKPKADCLCLPLSQGLVTAISPEDADLTAYTWTACRRAGVWYAFRNTEHGPQYLHREVAARLPNPDNHPVVDHRNGSGLDNRRTNIHWVSKSENARNRRLSRRSSSGYMGVRKCGQRWKAYASWQGAQIHLGAYSTAEAANRARLTWERDTVGILPRRRADFEEAGLV